MARRRVVQLSRSPWGRRLLWLVRHEARCTSQSRHAFIAAARRRRPLIPTDTAGYLNENDRTQADRWWRSFAALCAVLTVGICGFEVLLGPGTHSPLSGRVPVIASAGTVIAVVGWLLSRRYQRLNQAVEAQVESDHTTCELTSYFDAVQERTGYAGLSLDDGVAQLRSDVRRHGD